MATQVILLERVEKLGQMGDVVNVKPGYARNYLLPQKKALRANTQNIAYFEAQKKTLQADNDKLKKDAEKRAKTLDGLKAPLIRQASESGQLFGSVNSRDIAQVASEKSGETITRQMVALNNNFKTIGLFPVDIVLHPEVTVSVTINIARTPEEAEIQEKTGKALIADAETSADEAPTELDAETDLSDVLEESAMQIEADKAEAAVKREAEEQEAEAKRAEKAEKKAQKDAETAESDSEETAAEETSEEETAPQE